MVDYTQFSLWVYEQPLHIQFLVVFGMIMTLVGCYVLNDWDNKRQLKKRMRKN